MGGSSKSQTVGYKYYVGMHMALCHGPVDKLVRIRVGGKQAWVGENSGGALTIDKSDIFGGEKREGGVSGQVDIEMGGPTQAQNSYLAAKLGAGLLPAFRGVCCAVLRQVYIGLNPYLKDWGWHAQRALVRSNGQEQWYKSKALVNYYSFNDTIPPSYEEAGTSLNSYDIVVPPGSLDGVFSLIGGAGVCHDPSKQALGVATATWNGSLKWNVGRIDFTFTIPVKTARTDCAGMAFYDANDNAVLYILPHSQVYNNRPIAGHGTLYDTSLDVNTTYRIVIRQDSEEYGIVELFLGVLLIGSASCNSIKNIRGYRLGLNGANFPTAYTSVTYGPVAFQMYKDDPGYTITGLFSDMNPSHIVRECLTDTTWGMGYPEDDMGDSFFAAADTLLSEQMGISILWSQQTSIEDFVEEILRHIDAALYVDRSTGKFEIKLIRGGYDVSSLIVLDQSNISRVEGYTKQTLAEIANEVTISYNSNETGQTETVTLQNLAMIQQQGAIIPATVDYPGFANQAIASKAAARDLKAMSTPLVTATIYANREASALNIGSCFVWNWTETDENGNGVATSYVMRVTEIAFGDGVSNEIRIQCAQDVFALPEITYVEAQPTEWEDPSSDALPALPRLVTETPYYELVRQLGEVDVAAKLAGLPEIGFLMVAASRQAGEINAEIQVDSGAGYSGGGPLDFCPCAALDGAIGRLDTTATLKNGSDLDEFVAGSLAQIDDEIIVIDSITDGVATIKRGCLDTIPVTHADGAQAIIWDGYTASDEVEYVASDALDVKILTVTGQGPLAIADAPIDSVIMGQRALRPYPPANVQIGGEYYPSLVVADDLVGIVATWAHRDRIQQTGGEVLGWTAASVGPEEGVTYTARLVRIDTDVELDSTTGITGTTATFTPSYRGEVRVEVWAVRGGLESYQFFEHTFLYTAVAPVYYDSGPVYYDGNEVYYEL